MKPRIKKNTNLKTVFDEKMNSKYKRVDSKIPTAHYIFVYVIVRLASVMSHRAFAVIILVIFIPNFWNIYTRLFPKSYTYDNILSDWCTSSLIYVI